MTDPSGDVWDGGWWGESGTRPTRKELDPMSRRRPQGVSSHQGIRGKLRFGVLSRDDVMVHGGEEGWEVVRGSRRSGGMFMARWHGDETESSGLRPAAEDAKGDGSRTDTAVDESRNERVDRVTRYRFD